MAQISAQLVKILREKTDAPMLECKKALTEAEGDLSKAEEILKVRLGNKVVKASQRSTTEGLVAIQVSEDGHCVAMVEVNCETDFVTRNEHFQAFVHHLTQLLLSQSPLDLPALLDAKMSDGHTVEEARVALIGRIGENISIRRFVTKKSENTFMSYVHNGSIGVFVEYKGKPEIAKDVALHIVAARPVCLTRDQVPQQLVEQEKQVFIQQAQASGKPQAVIEKMIEGRLSKFLAEMTLFEQPFVKDSTQTVAAILEANQSAVLSFSLFSVGEGLKKESTDFAQEVASVVKAHQ